jgi:hypothetical protein
MWYWWACSLCNKPTWGIYLFGRVRTGWIQNFMCKHKLHSVICFQCPQLCGQMQCPIMYMSGQHKLMSVTSSAPGFPGNRPLSSPRVMWRFWHHWVAARFSCLVHAEWGLPSLLTVSISSIHFDAANETYVHDDLQLKALRLNLFKSSPANCCWSSLAQSFLV